LGVERFNQGAYYAQHDAFEALWMAESGPVRELYRAILQVGIAYYHVTRGNHAGGLKMLRRCVQWFAVLPDECQGIDVRQLRNDAARVHAALLAIAPDEIANFDRALLKPVPRTTYD
jgi:predicted metal-dependent hydrolase